MNSIISVSINHYNVHLGVNFTMVLNDMEASKRQCINDLVIDLFDEFGDCLILLNITIKLLDKFYASGKKLLTYSTLLQS